jgi:hypothetical protein
MRLPIFLICIPRKTFDHRIKYWHSPIGSLNQDIQKVGIAWAIDFIKTSFSLKDSLGTCNISFISRLTGFGHPLHELRFSLFIRCVMQDNMSQEF